MNLLPTYLHVSYKVICTISTIGAQNRREKKSPRKNRPKLRITANPTSSGVQKSPQVKLGLVRVGLVRFG